MVKNIWSDDVTEISEEEFLEGINTIAKCYRGLAEDITDNYKHDEYMQGIAYQEKRCANDLEELLAKFKNHSAENNKSHKSFLEKLLEKLDKKELEKLEK